MLQACPSSQNLECAKSRQATVTDHSEVSPDSKSSVKMTLNGCGVGVAVGVGVNVGVGTTGVGVGGTGVGVGVKPGQSVFTGSTSKTLVSDQGPQMPLAPARTLHSQPTRLSV
jgi:hypothetical protein